MKEEKFRNKIYWFIFVFSMLVIWVHSYNAKLFLGTGRTADMVDRAERLLGDVVAQVAVPGFFIISGYLFFRNFTMDRLWNKWNSRIKTVLVPFVVWNTIYYAAYAAGSRIPWLCDILDKGIIPVNLNALVDAVLHYRYNYVFWYLYQLIMLVMLAPVIYFFLSGRYRRWIYLICLFAGLLAGVSLSPLNLDALLFYSVAADAALNHKKMTEAAWSKKRFLSGAAVLAAACGVYWYSIHFYSVSGIAVYRFLVPVALWFMVNENRLFEAKQWMKINFFLYALHFLLVRFINKAAAMYIPGIPAVPVMLYLMMPAIILMISYPIAVLLQRHFTALWRLLTGGRN
ncbi:hypothetical protein C0033_25380 [Clostridium sp. chh4-2]|uniref:acyltransferase family protein n=1 Tax=Clostridium sp. chh4-2 TaxID=2067550 RepID=UPI000CCF37C9|nr:acyltransferase [Clostridium sp. chh4-2]PNV59139.1 hypothetical protein C0033_25380 [Clostridium sp. chh4-2]